MWSERRSMETFNPPSSRLRFSSLVPNRASRFGVISSCLFIDKLGFVLPKGEMRRTARVPRYRDHSCWLSRAEELRNVVHVRGTHPSGVEYPRFASKSINGLSIVHCPCGHSVNGKFPPCEWSISDIY